MPPRDRLEHPDLPVPEDTTPVGPCAPFEPDGAPPPVFVPDVVPPGTEGKVAEAVEAAVTRLQQELQKMVDGFNSIVAAVHRFAQMLGPEIVEAARVVLEKLRQLIEAAIDVVLYIMERYAPFAAVSLAMFGWLNNVKEPMKFLSTAVGKDDSDNMVYWKGQAAELYKDKVRVQKAAVVGIVDVAGEVSNWLKDVFKSNAAYTESLANLLATLAGKIAEAAVKAGTVFGIPDAIKVLENEIGVIVTTMAQFVVDGAKRVVEAIDRAHTLTDKMADKLPEGAWPQAVRN